MTMLNSNIQEYIDIVESGGIAVCKEQIKLVSLVKDIFASEDIYVDEELMNRYLSLQKYFPFDLFPWQKFCFALHNCTFRRDGFLRFPRLDLFVGRGTGKNGYAAFEGFSNITPINGVDEYHVQVVATVERQAMTSFKDVYNVLEKNERIMKSKFSWNKTVITNKKTRSEFYYGTGSANSKDGGREGEIIIDEEHQYENSDLIDVLEGGLGKTAKPRILRISSFGDVRDGPMDDDVETGIQILDRIIPDGGRIPFICRLDEDEEVHDEKNWVKSCPSLPYLPNLMETYRQQYNAYKKNPSQHLAFMTKRMGRPQGTSNKPVTTLENIMATKQAVPAVKGLKCIAGIDYARLNDFAAAGFLFLVDGKAVWLTHTWVCSRSDSLHRVKAPLKKWEAEGRLTFVDDVEISPDLITDWMKEQIEKNGFIVIKGALDSFRFQLVKQSLEKIGFDADKKGRNNLKLVRPSDVIKAVPVIDSYFNNHNIIWGDNPLMRWYVNNAMLKKERSGEFSYGKQEPKSRKTDGFMAFAAAMTQIDDLIAAGKPINFESIKVYEF